MKVSVIGSCLSANVATALRRAYGAELLPSLHHTRSDALRAFFVDQSYGPPDDATLDRIIAKYGDPAKKKKNRTRVVPSARVGATVSSGERLTTTAMPVAAKIARSRPRAGGWEVVPLAATARACRRFRFVIGQ